MDWVELSQDPTFMVFIIHLEDAQILQVRQSSVQVLALPLVMGPWKSHFPPMNLSCYWSVKGTGISRHTELRQEFHALVDTGMGHSVTVTSQPR